MKVRSWCGPSVLAATLLVTLACSVGDGSRPATEGGNEPHVVIVTLEGGWSASSAAQSIFDDPVFEGFVAFEDAMTTSPQARPAIASLMTGQGPDRLQVRTDFAGVLESEVPYLPEILGGAGWTTAAFVANPNLGRASGLARGFSLFDAPLPQVVYGPARLMQPMRAPDEVVSNFLSWKDARTGSGPFFAWIHLAGPGPVPGTGAGDTAAPAGPGSTRSALDRVVEALRADGTLDHTVVVVAAVTGHLSPSGAEGAGYFLSPAVLDIPVAARAPHTVAAWNGDALLWLPDLASMVLARAGLPSAVGEPVPVDQGSRTRYGWSWRGATEFGWPVESAALEDDVLVVREGAGEPVEVYRWSTGELLGPESAAGAGEALAARPLPMDAPSPARPRIPPEVQREIDALGLTVPDQIAVSALGRASRAESLSKILEARTAAAGGNLVEARDAYRVVIEIDPDNAGAHLEMAENWINLMRPGRANKRLSFAFELAPGDPGVWHALGHVAHMNGEYERADVLFRATDSMVPDQADVLYDLACTRTLLGDLDEGVSYLRRAWDGGFRNVNHIQADIDLRELRADPRYELFMQEVLD